MPAEPLRFDRFELQPQERRLLADGQPVALGARAFDVLVLLVERAGSLVLKNELLERVWAGLVVEEANLTVQVSSLRKVLGGELIATIPGRGYRFTGPVQAVPSTVSCPAPPAAVPATAVAARTLVGRGAELQRLRAALAEPGCLSLVGPAGVGKTSLARTLAAGWPAGAVWVDLAALTAAPQMPVALALAMGQPAAAPLPSLAGLIGERLLVLDNAEHLIDAAAALALTLQQAHPALALLVTCQLPLSLPSERVQRIEPLALPGDDSALDGTDGALALFVERARAADHRFAPGPDALPLLRALCRQLDGLPLALEMAAARVPALGLQGLHDALAQRFAVLTRGARTAAERHRTLQAALDWSHGLLSAEEQRLFRALGVFAGGFTLELAVAVAESATQDRWAVIDTLATLVDRSLVSADAGDLPRYRLLETMRAYALAQLQATGEEQALRKRHAQALAAVFAAAASPTATPAERERGLAEHDNAREALAWATAHDAAVAVALSTDVATTASFVAWRSEALRWMEACEHQVDDPAVPAHSRALWWVERARQLLISHRPEARQVAETACALTQALGDERIHFHALVALVRSSRSSHTDIAARCQELKALVDAHPEWPGRLAMVMHGTLSMGALLQSDLPGALTHRQAELELARLHGNPQAVDVAESNVMNMLYKLGRFDEALAMNDVLVARMAKSEDVNLAYALNTRMALLVRLRRHDELRAMAAQINAMFDRFQMPYYLERWALMLVDEGQARAAAQLVGRQRQQLQDLHQQATAPTEESLELVHQGALAFLSEADWQAEVARGRQLGGDAALALVLKPPVAGQA